MKLYEYTVYQNKGPKDTNEAFDASFGNVDPIFFLKNYKEVCKIAANNLEEVFAVGNVGPEDQIIERFDRMHSISVGDVIKAPKGNIFVVKPFGFERMGA